MDRQEIFKHEVKLWNVESRSKFIRSAIMSANGNLNDNQRAEFHKERDAWLRKAETQPPVDASPPDRLATRGLRRGVVAEF
jgi:hypothetical protein